MEDSLTDEPDRIDRAILRALQADGRLSNADLAAKVNVSAATCHRRTQRLFATGHLGPVRARVRPETVGLGTLVMVGAVLDRSTPESFAAFEAAVQDLPAVLDCILVAGELDYLMKIRVGDMKDFNRLHAEALINLPGVRQIRSFFVLKEVKEGGLLAF